MQRNITHELSILAPHARRQDQPRPYPRDARAFLASCAPELTPADIAAIPEHELRDWQDLATRQLMEA